MCVSLQKIANCKTSTRAELKDCKQKRKQHRDDIRALRMRYHEDVQRSLVDPTFQVVTFDGADQAKTRVPQEWRRNVHGDYIHNGALIQKLQTVLMHGVGIRFYISPPFISKGMDLTVFTLMDSLFTLPTTVDTVRLQYDGGSENVNYAVQVLCGLLLQYDVFKDIYCNRLPVG